MGRFMPMAALCRMLASEGEHAQLLYRHNPG